MKCVRLRVKNVDFARQTITARSGKWVLTAQALPLRRDRLLLRGDSIPCVNGIRGGAAWYTLRGPIQ